MVAGGRAVLRRAKMDDDEYVADEDEEEEEDDAEVEVEPEGEDESGADGEGEGAEEEEDEDLGIDSPPRPRGRGRKARSDDGDSDDSDADFDGAEEESEDEEDLEVDTPRPRPRPRRPATARRRGGPKRKREPDEDSDADFEEELETDADSDGEDQGFEIETPRPKRAPRARRRARKPKPHDESDADSDEDEGFQIETPRSKRATRARRRARKPKPHDESDADSDEDEGYEVETPRPKRAPRAHRRARKPKQHDESDTDFGEEEDQGFEIETPRPKRAPSARSTARKPKPHDESDADSDGEDDDGLENEEWEVEAPWPKRPPTVRSRRRREDQETVQSDADFKGEEEEPQNDELEVETPQPASSGSNVRQEDNFDADLNGAEEEVEDEEEDEELEIEMPQSVDYRSGGTNLKQEDEFDVDFNGADEEVDDQEEDVDLETETPQLVKYRSGGRNMRQEDESDADFNGADEEFEDQEDDEELETETPQLRNPSEARGMGRKVKPAGSSRQRHEDDDDYEEEIEDEDEDFEPEMDEEEEDEEEDVEEENDDLGDYAPTRATKVRPRNHLANRKPAARRQHRKRKSGSRVSKGNTRNGMSARRRRRNRRMAGDYEDDEEEDDDDDDFVVSDDVVEEVPRKKAKVGSKTMDGTAEPVGVGEAWPLVESDTSEFEFVTSEEEHAENEAPVGEPAKIKRKKGKRKKGSESDSSSDSDYVISEEELKDLGMPQETVPQLPPHPARRTIVSKIVDGKGKEPEEALKQICGICLSEEQRVTIQGMLNCCSHYFCFACILEWSKVESKCPLCKRRFNTITKSSVADLGLGLRNAPVRVEKRDQVYQPTDEEMRRWLDPYENVVCIECNQGGDDNLMLLCDICDSSAHTFCVGLGREVPEGNWYCGGCRFSVEGPSYAQTPTQERVVHRSESNMNTGDSSSGSFGRSIPSGVFQRPPPINVQPSLQGFDLNLSPIETPEEDKRAESHIPAEPVSTPTGRHATLDRRRALNRRIRILLFRPRTATNAWQNSVQHDDRSAAGTEQNQRNTSTCTDLSPSCSRPDFMQSQQSSSHFVQSASNLNQCTDEGGTNFREVVNAKDELIPIVKKSIKHICARLDQSSFTNVARRATHTILALSGIAHNRDRVVSTPFPFPSHCCHACDGREPAFLMRTICSSCFNLFVGDVVSHIANMFS